MATDKRRLLLLVFTALATFLQISKAGSNPPHPEGLLLRGFESEAALNRRGDQAVLNGVSTTIRVDAAGELSSSVSANDLSPLVEWYQDREQYYSAYGDFAPGIASAIGYTTTISDSGKTLDLDGNTSSPSIFTTETYDAIVTVAKGYVDAGVDAIHYDTAWVTGDAGPFDATTMVDFRTWLNARYSEATLQSYVDASYDASTFDYGAFLRSKSVTKDNYGSATISSVPLGQTKHWRLWHAFLRYKEREVISALVNEVNTYAQSELGREIGFYFNRYGFIHRPADRWFLAEYASGDLGETHFTGESWEFADGINLEPVYRAALKTYDNRFESWNSPPATNNAVQSVFLAEALANNGVATWEDDYPATASVARLAKQFESQLDLDTVSEAAIFYPLATVLHNQPGQTGSDPGTLGGDHYWYLGLGYILQDLEINYDVAFAGDDLGMADSFSSSDISTYDVVFVSEAIQVTDSQFTELMDYVNGGGTLIVSGTNCLRYDELGDDQSSTRTYDSKTWTQLLGSVGNTSIGSGTLKVVSLDPWGSYGYTEQPSSSTLTTIVSSIESALPSGLERTTSSASGDVRILRYSDSSDDSEVYHLINYTFNEAGTAVTSQTSFTVSFPTPSSYVGTPTASYASSADSAATTLTITDLGGGMSQVTIPTLGYWGILRIGSALTETEHPNIEPIAYFDSLFSYEVFGSSSTKTLTYSAFDDDEISSLQVYYSEKDLDTGLFGPWTASQTIAGTGTNELSDATVEYSFPSEGHFRLQIVATDSDAAANELLGSDAYDTEAGYDTTAVDRSSLVVSELLGIPDGTVTTEPLTPSFSFTGQVDPISGFGQYNWSWNNGGNTIDGGGDNLTETVILPSLPAMVEGEYGEYELSLRFQNGAEIWDDSESVFSIIYTVIPTYNGSEEDRDATDGESVAFNLDYTNPYGDVSIQWYKDGAAMSGETGDTLDLGTVDSDDSATYHATIANPAGSITSTDFNLSVTTPLEITSQPAGAIISEGDSFSVTVEARGTGTLSYQWTLEGVDISGATSATYSISSAVRATHHGHYRAVVTDDLTSVTSNGAFVQISNQPSGGGESGEAPSAPINLSATDNGTDAVTLSWQDTSTNETGFALERKEEGSSTWVSVSSGIPANDTQFIDATDIGSTSYEYRIKATGSSSDSDYSNVALVSRSSGPAPLATPTSLSASDNTAHVRLTWTDNATSETGYTIERKLESESSWSVVATIGENSQAFTDPIDIGTSSYEYRVKATDATDSSDYSNVAAVSRESGSGGESDPAPTAPASLDAVDQNTQVSLTWDDLSDNETGFALERKEEGSSTWVSVSDSIPADQEQFIDVTDIGSTTYEYRIKATGSTSDSDYSNVASLTRSSSGESGEGGESEEPTPPTAPANLAAVDGTAFVSLSWNDLSHDETGFSIQRRVQGETTWTQVSTTAENVSSYQDNIDIGDETYEYRVAADKDSVASDYSNVATVTRVHTGTSLGLSLIADIEMPLVITLDSSDTADTLRSTIATELQVSAESLRLFVGATELTDPTQTLTDIGLSHGNQLTAIQADDTATSNYANWSLSTMGDTLSDRLPEEDANNDGVSNYLHYAFGTSPLLENPSANLVAISVEGEFASLSFRRNKNASDIEFAVEVLDENSGTWSEISSSELSETTYETEDEAIETVVIEINRTLDRSVLLRLKVSRK
ncbi:hypothetical protein [Pelagicoccus albus]|uniref:Fibronectin type III domain-containing protein n=1 Tax=Pelagicoccus albus TaxID=415222 RepID=A0A7X1B7W9_9BACT|nr:hypothetical protein [Pelagicoccus albus]MBC2607313.1 hypothetical protein [Pelagicoccus albus]